MQDTDALEKRLVLAGFVGCKTAISPTGDAMVPSASLGVLELDFGMTSGS